MPEPQDNLLAYFALAAGAVGSAVTGGLVYYASTLRGWWPDPEWLMPLTLIMAALTLVLFFGLGLAWLATRRGGD